MSKFSVGDCVVLKSGGPVMTVQEHIARSDFFRCQWFAGKKLSTGSFPEDSLGFAPEEAEQEKK